MPSGPPIKRNLQLDRCGTGRPLNNLVLPEYLTGHEIKLNEQENALQLSASNLSESRPKDFSGILPPMEVHLSAAETLISCNSEHEDM